MHLRLYCHEGTMFEKLKMHLFSKKHVIADSLRINLQNLMNAP